jgi:hypothetical protein
MPIRAERVLVSALLLTILGEGFFAVGAWTADRSVAPPPLTASFHPHISLVPLLVRVYVSCYPATAIVLTDRERFRRACAAYAVGFAAG